MLIKLDIESYVMNVLRDGKRRLEQNVFRRTVEFVSAVVRLSKFFLPSIIFITTVTYIERA